MSKFPSRGGGSEADRPKLVMAEAGPTQSDNSLATESEAAPTKAPPTKTLTWIEAIRKDDETAFKADVTTHLQDMIARYDC